MIDIEVVERDGALGAVAAREGRVVGRLLGRTAYRLVRVVRP
jgi:hypothetical protein